MPFSWNDSLSQRLNLLRTDRKHPLRICMIGVGNDLRGDDSAGLTVARQLLANEQLNGATNILILEGGPAPENQTGKLRAFQPDLVLFIDAAHLSAPPGTIQLIPLEVIDGMSASSHSLPLSILARYITAEFGCQVEVVGIQPAQNEFDADLSAPVQAAVDEILRLMVNLFAQTVQ